MKWKNNLPVNYNKLKTYEKRSVREKYIELQNGKCYFCNKSLNEEPKWDKKINRKLFPKNFFKSPVHLHHDHNTGMTIGAVHNYCNAVLWQYHGE